MFGIIGVVGGLYTYLRRRENRILQQQKILEEMVTERTRQLKEKKKEVELQNEEIAKKNKDITGSIYYAQRIQEAVLPDRDNLIELIPESFIFFKPRDIVSGHIDSIQPLVRPNPQIPITIKINNIRSV